MKRVCGNLPSLGASPGEVTANPIRKHFGFTSGLPPTRNESQSFKIVFEARF